MAAVKFPLPFFPRKAAGVMIPLFSLRSTRNWGIGDFGDVPPFMDWMTRIGLRVLEILPLNELSPGETCPYQALSGFASDPMYLALDRWPDVRDSVEAQRVVDAPDTVQALAAWRDAPQVAYGPIRALKDRVLRLAFDHFLCGHEAVGSPRAQAFHRFAKDQADWLEPYAAFRVLKTLQPHRAWSEWPPPFRDRDGPALERLRAEHDHEWRYVCYQQWAVWEQWVDVRRDAARLGVRIMGDLPFLVSRDSADVWSRPDEFDPTRGVGAPADPVNPEQDWGLPLFRWSTVEATGFPWWSLRLSLTGQWFDLLRLDHVVGFFRVWVMSPNETSHFEPADEAEQIRRGEVFLTHIAGCLGDCLPIAEDLGTIPPFVRSALSRMGIAGHKVVRWEREDGVYRNPSQYPYVSLATPGTHDTSTLSIWWKTADAWERDAFLRLFDAGAARDAAADQPGVVTPAWHRMMLDRVIGSGSGLVILPMQDILGEDGQINVPGTVGPHNWTYRMPCTIEALNHPPWNEHGDLVKTLLIQHGRAETDRPGMSTRGDGPS